MFIEWTETRLVPVLDTMHVADGYENICESCDQWGVACESCDVSVPIIGEFEAKEVKMCQPTICGIPVGRPYQTER